MPPAEVLLFAVGIFCAAPVQKAPVADALLDAGWHAVGGGKAPPASLEIHGHTRVLIGSTGKLSEPRTLSIRVLQPDRFLRITSDRTFESRFGFAGDELLNGIRALKPGDTFGATYGPEQIGLERAWVARFMLGMLSQKAAVTRMQVRPSSAASVEVTGSEGFSAAVDFDTATGMPLRVRHQANVHFPVPGSLAPPPPEKAEVVWTFQDRRAVGGLRLPHRIVRTARDVTLEEMQFDTVLVNPPLTAKDFNK